MIKTVKNLLNTGRGTAAAAALLAGSALVGVGALHAQNAPANSDPFNLPSSITMLGKADPNLRKATAVVNGFVITGSDIDQRVALVLDANKQESTPEELQRLRLQVLRNLIDETLQIQEAKALEIEVTSAEVDQTYERVATQNFGQSKGELDAYLKKIGSSTGSLKRQIEGELAWQRILQRNVQPFINVSEEEVNEVLERMKAAKGTEEYRLGEIYLAATAENEQSVAENARKIMDQLQQGGSFVAYARQYSQASSAAVGGDLGWIRPSLLPTEMAAAARQMQAGQLVGPVKVPGGMSIMYMIDKRQVLTADPRDAVLSLKQISIKFTPGTSQEDFQAKVTQFNAGLARMKGCGTADGIAAEMGAEVVTNDELSARALPDALAQDLLQLSIGQYYGPFGTVEDGVRVLMLCGRDDPKVADDPSFDKVMAQIEDDRVNKRAQRYLRDLRRDAVIEYN
ncbi:MAG TPA: peptidylprolyl isomerase [Sphingomonadaceae bacterium]|nr:peptidylprolyl isomerase [Sphingomonadaceae bacterium]